MSAAEPVDVPREPVPDGFAAFEFGVDDASAVVAAHSRGLGLVLVDREVTAAAIDQAIQLARQSAGVVACAGPVTDTIKEVSDGFVVGTFDRDALLAVRPPVVIPPELVAAAGADPSRWTPDGAERLGDWLQGLAGDLPVRYLTVGT